MIAVARATPSEQPSLMKTRGDRYPGRSPGYYVRVTIAERCRWGAAAVGEH
jgi:hypothetical protein